MRIDVKKVFDGMSGAYAAMFTPYDAKRFAELGVARPGRASR